MTSTQLILIDEEINSISSLLRTIPFNRSATSTDYFLGLYKLNYDQLIGLNDHKFPIDSSKLLKLGISLGNLLKTLQQDEEVEGQQQQQQQQVQRSVPRVVHQQLQHAIQSTNVGSPPPSSAAVPSTPERKSGPKQLPPTPKSNSQSSPFLSDLPPTPPPKPHIITSNNAASGQLDSEFYNTSNNPFNYNGNGITASYPIYQIKFIKNLLSILKNFDIGNVSVEGLGISSPTNVQRVGSISSSNSSVSSQTTLPSNAQGNASINVSPIKLNSRQLLIEKLEININLDTLFIYKIVFNLLLQILNNIYENIIKINPPPQPSTPSKEFLGNPLPPRQIKLDDDETSSIFSSNSDKRNSNGGIRHSAISNGSKRLSGSSHETHEKQLDYNSILSQCIQRISSGIVDPFKRFVFVELVESNLQQDFNQLLTTLA
ncbi:uncharacterized protein RJT21DRAFT_53409 [Scheffersomyces amazonensis]|uniref:uncharacterized protein n=1 Tax=Scheffersomyces amazonensis TaxID=1078765 RepID=UPI00315D94F8